MPAPEESPTTESSSGKNFVKLLVILVTVIFPGILLVIGIYMNYTAFQANQAQKMTEETADLSGETIAGALRPSQVLENKYAYLDKNLFLVGMVTMEPVTCARKECPKEDTCCGCPAERDLVIADQDKVVVKDTSYLLRLFAPGQLAYCVRVPGSCDYQCPGWEINDVYQVRGTFFGDPPDKGTAWRPFLDFYFEVSEAQVITQAKSTDWLKRVFKGIEETVQQLRNSGYYILQ